MLRIKSWIESRSASKGLLCMVLTCAAGSIPFSLAGAARADDKRSHTTTTSPPFSASGAARATIQPRRRPTWTLPITQADAGRGVRGGHRAGRCRRQLSVPARHPSIRAVHAAEGGQASGCRDRFAATLDQRRRTGKRRQQGGKPSRKWKLRPPCRPAAAGSHADAAANGARAGVHMARPMARSVATSPWVPLAAVASQRQVLLYNTKSLELVGVFPFPEGQPNVVRFSRDGRLLLAGGGEPAASGKVVVWDITTGERVVEVGKELDAVLAADISANHKLIVLGGPQRQVRVYSTETGKLKYEIAKHTDWVMRLNSAPTAYCWPLPTATADCPSGKRKLVTNTSRSPATRGPSTRWRGAEIPSIGVRFGRRDVCLWEMENGTAVKKWNAKSPLLSVIHPRWPPRHRRPRSDPANVEPKWQAIREDRRLAKSP